MKCLIILFILSSVNALAQKDVILKSRAATFLIFNDSTVTGTGFAVSNSCIVTCFHVIGKAWFDSNQNGRFQYANIFKNLRVKNEAGEIFEVELISIPSITFPEPALLDFAILRLKSGLLKTWLPINNSASPSIGDKVILSGFPFTGYGSMLTLFGSIAFMDADGFFIQSSITAGNSGGALLNETGEVIGFITRQNSVLGDEIINGAPPLPSFISNPGIEIAGLDIYKSMIATMKALKQNSETGVGTAYKIRHVNNYIIKRKIQLVLN